MKKQLFLASALALVTLASCGGKSNGPAYKPGTPLKVGLICLHDEASTYDNNFIQAFNKAVEKAKGENKISKSFVKTDIAESQACGDAAKQLVNQGCNIIFSDSFGHDEYMYPAAKEYPNVVFSSATGVLAYNGGVQNYHNAFASIYEGRYLAGFAAGKYMLADSTQKGKMDALLNTGKTINVGYVGAFNYAEVISGYTSWFLGLKEGLYDASSVGTETKYQEKLRMKVKYTNSWYDENGEKAAALALIGSEENPDCILISQHADSMGAPNACKDRHIPDVSYNMNTVEMGGDTYKETYISHSKINWEPYYTEVINRTYEGRAISGETDRNWTGTLDTDSVQYGLSKEYFNDDGSGGKVKKQDIIDEAEALKNGTKHVFDLNKFTVTKTGNRNKNADITFEGGASQGQGKLATYKADITGDYAPDIDIIAEKDGAKYVNESYYRSAPSFDLIIDGIEELQ